MENLLGVFAIIAAAVVFGIVLNPYFLQGFRNSKFWDYQKEIKNKDLINPDNY